MYAVNILGVRGPRKMTALVPAPPQVRWRLADAFRFVAVTLSRPLLPPRPPCCREVIFGNVSECFCSIMVGVLGGIMASMMRVLITQISSLQKSRQRILRDTSLLLGSPSDLTPRMPSFPEQAAVDRTQQAAGGKRGFFATSSASSPAADGASAAPVFRSSAEDSGSALIDWCLHTPHRRSDCVLSVHLRLQVPVSEIASAVKRSFGHNPHSTAVYFFRPFTAHL